LIEIGALMEIMEINLSITVVTIVGLTKILVIVEEILVEIATISETIMQMAEEVLEIMISWTTLIH
jgi:hypothetical protein